MERLTGLPTLRIDPETHIPFTYRAESYTGLKGDTIATALFANDIRIFGRSLKYHRPRGLYSMDPVCSNTCMQVNGIPNIHAEIAKLSEQMDVRPQNVLGSPEFDRLGFLDRLDWAMPAGFYYRTMHKPYRLWPFFRRLIRKAAGLGMLSPVVSIRGDYDEIYVNTDICVVGGGPAGMSAALAAANTGLQVVVLESRPNLGGCFDYRTETDNAGDPLYRRSRALTDRMLQHPQVRVFTRTTLIGAYNDNLITAIQVGEASGPFDERYIEIRAKSLIAATGCIERPLLFEHNERPGVMQADCALRMAHTYGLLPGKAAVFSVGNDFGLEVAANLADLGVSILAVADCRQDGHDARRVDALKQRGIPFMPGWAAAEAHGRTSVEKATLTAVGESQTQTYDCDLLVASAGFTPMTGPLALFQTEMAYDAHIGYFLPTALPKNTHMAGRMLGFEDPDAVEASGHFAGIWAAADCGKGGTETIQAAKMKLDRLPGPKKGSQWVMPPGGGRKSFVCFDEDVTVKQIRQACDMGFDAVELAKRFTAAGTGPGQGGIPGHNLPLVIAHYQDGGAGPPKPSTVRAPLVPASLVTLAGAKHDLYKKTPVHDSQVRMGAIMRRIDPWKRARYYSQDTHCREEITAVRQRVGLIEVATLGKFRIFGPDALNALQRVYVGNMAAMPEGKAKYAAMCNDDGCLIDDGVVVQRGENDYYLTTSSARAGATAEWFRYHTRYDGWTYHLVNLTDALGAINLAGPQARSVLGKLTDADLSNAAFPFMGYREFMLAGTVPSRVLRLGFVGELSYEIHMPASCMQTVWDLLLDAGKEWDIRPFGLEAQSCLRLEKGHIIIGQESEARTTLHDLGLGFLWYRDKAGAKTVGAVALKQTEHQEGRLKLAGIQMTDADACPLDGSVIVGDGTILGHVCTARYSFTLRAAIGLALVESQFAAVGTMLEVFEPGKPPRRLSATVVPTPFYDPEGKRLRA